MVKQVKGEAGAFVFDSFCVSNDFGSHCLSKAAPGTTKVINRVLSIHSMHFACLPTACVILQLPSGPSMVEDRRTVLNSDRTLLTIRVRSR